MPLNFEKYAAAGNEFVNRVAQELAGSKDKAGRIIRAVLHALRNRLSHEESFQLMAQLPMALKGVYVDGWKFGREFNRIHTINDFLDEVRQEDGSQAGYDFGNNAEAKITVAAVFKVLNYFVSEGEMGDIVAVMPKEVREFIKESIGGNQHIL